MSEVKLVIVAAVAVSARIGSKRCVEAVGDGPPDVTFRTVGEILCSDPSPSHHLRYRRVVPAL